MSEAPPDFRVLARRYLDLWHEQASAVATDPALAETIARGIAAMAEGTTAFVQAAQHAAWPHQVAQPSPNGKAGHGPQPSGNPSEPALPPGSAAAPPPFDGAGLDPDGLVRRLAILEERVAALEAELGRARPGPAPKPRRRRT